MTPLTPIRAAVDAMTPGPYALMPALCGPEGQGIYNEDGGCIVEVGDPYPRGKNHPQENMVAIHALMTHAKLLLDVAECADCYIDFIDQAAKTRIGGEEYIQAVADGHAEVDRDLRTALLALRSAVSA